MGLLRRSGGTAKDLTICRTVRYNNYNGIGKTITQKYLSQFNRIPKETKEMARFSFVLAFIACVGMSVSIVFAQDINGGTVRGKITDTSEKQNPIEGVEVFIIRTDGTEFRATTDANGDYVRAGLPAGRYLISIFKEGYGDRVGKPVTVVNGGDHYVPLKMTKKSGVATFLQKFGVGQKETFKDIIDEDFHKNMAENPNAHWYNLTLMNNKIGYVHTSTDKTEYEGEKVDRTKIDIVMNFKALGTDITVEITRVEYTGADLMPRYFL
ncbi:carboxypeptidase regulatory-like domain-containing protein, partial [Candidatus Poribacteria bacterium]|nr:carboxypeptidase regulatory-like domain-containing protein [Candidatus Poribacteria bacterium]